MRGRFARAAIEVEVAMMGPRAARDGWHLHVRSCTICTQALEDSRRQAGPRHDHIAERACHEGKALIRRGWNVHGVRLW